MDRTERFWDRIAQKYAARPIQDEAAYARTLECSAAHLGIEDRVLEVGCGPGTSALRLAAGVQHILATDLSSALLRIARQRAADQQVSNVEFVHGDFFALSFEPSSFDAVMAFNLMHLLADVPGMLQRVHSALKPGGVFISKTMCLGERRMLYAPMMFMMRMLGQAPPIYCWKIADLEACINDAGLEVVETGNYPAKPPSRFVVARKR